MFVSRKCHTIPWTSPPTPAAPLITTTDHLLKLFRNPPERQSPSLSPPITHSSSCSSSSLSPLSIIFSHSFALTSFQAQDLAVRQTNSSHHGQLSHRTDFTQFTTIFRTNSSHGFCFIILAFSFVNIACRTKWSAFRCSLSSHV